MAKWLMSVEMRIASQPPFHRAVVVEAENADDAITVGVLEIQDVPDSLADVTALRLEVKKT